jgi:tetratricopeptide (TPR) repeat protein
MTAEHGTLCPACDYQSPPDARFCAWCGAILKRDDVARQLAYAFRLEEDGRLGDAILEYEMLTGRPDLLHRAIVLKHLGNLHFRLGHLRRAKRYLGDACALEPANATFRHDLGIVHYHLAEFEAAGECFEAALRSDPDLQLSWFWLGNSRYLLGRRDEAIAAFRELLDRYPNFAVAHFRLGVIYARAGEKEKAEAEFRRVLEKNPEAAVARFYMEAAIEGK